MTIYNSSTTIFDLLENVTALRTQVADQGQRIFTDFEKYLQRDEFRDSALNLAHYLALCRHYLRELQFDLVKIGFASLGRIESNVLGTLTAIERILQSLCHGKPFEQVGADSYFLGMNQLHQETTTVFGPQPEDRGVRIMVTLSTEAASNPEYVLDLIQRGMNCARINCAHDNVRIWQAMVHNIRQAEQSTGKPCSIYMDLAGPKIRTQAVGFDNQHLFFAGDTLLLTRNKPTATEMYPYQLSCAVPEVIDQVEVSQSVWFDDGKIGTPGQSPHSETTTRHKAGRSHTATGQSHP